MKYGTDTPIFVSEVSVPNMSQNAVRQYFMRLCKDGKLKRYDTGVYYIPTKTAFGTDSTLSRNPGFTASAVSGDHSMNPVASKRFIPAATAWYAVGDSLIYAANRFAVSLYPFLLFMLPLPSPVLSHFYRALFLFFIITKLTWLTRACQPASGETS